MSEEPFADARPLALVLLTAEVEPCRRCEQPTHAVARFMYDDGSESEYLRWCGECIGGFIAGTDRGWTPELRLVWQGQR